MSSLAAFDEFASGLRWDNYRGAEYTLVAAQQADRLIILRCRLILRHAAPEMPPAPDSILIPAVFTRHTGRPCDALAA